VVRRVSRELQLAARAAWSGLEHRVPPVPRRRWPHTIVEDTVCRWRFYAIGGFFDR